MGEVLVLPEPVDTGMATGIVFLYEFRCPMCNRRYNKKIKILADDFDFRLREYNFRCLSCQLKCKYHFKLGVQLGCPG